MLEIKGALREINLEDRSFRIYWASADQPYVVCRYGERHEVAVKDALDKCIAVTGEETRDAGNGQILELRVASIEVLGDAASLSSGPPPAPRRRMTAKNLLVSGLVGVWKDRSDIQDSPSFARALRRRAEERRSE